LVIPKKIKYSEHNMFQLRLKWYSIIINAYIIKEENSGKEAHIPIITLDSNIEVNLAVPCKDIYS